MFQLIIRPKALEMINDSYVWYEEQKKGLGEVFLEELSQRFQQLQLSPALYGKVKKNYRQLVLKNFPFVLIFEIIEKNIILYNPIIFRV